MATSTMVEELQEQLFTRERELVSRESVVVMWEDGLTASECTLGRAFMECDAKHTQTEAVR
jgi:hypothetical protein